MKRDGNTGGNVGWWLGGGRKVGAWLLAAHTAESPGGVAEALLSCCGKETSCHLRGTMRFIAMNSMSSHISFCPPPPHPAQNTLTNTAQIVVHNPEQQKSYGHKDRH